jgi:EAL and modified HD-GYP domain-containing signal transduction protein
VPPCQGRPRAVCAAPHWEDGGDLRLRAEVFLGSAVYIGRQPIFDAKLEVVAYDLLYRDSEANRASVPDNDLATSRVIVDAVMEFGLERLAGRHQALIKMAPGFLADESLIALPPDRVLFELLETPHPGPDLVEAVRALTERGYRIALGDFFYTEEWAPLLDLVHWVKLNVAQMNRFQMAHQMEQLRRHCVSVIACRVDGPDLLTRCRELGFDHFMGHFLAKPEVARARRMPTSRLAVLRLLAELNDPGTAADRIEALIAGDVSFGYHLLRYINSPAFAVPRKVDSIRQAIILLGLHRLRRWATLVAMMEMNDKPHELMVTAMVRARMCETLAQTMGPQRADAFYTVGLFSVLDALTDAPMERAVEGLPLGDEIRAALLTQEGPAGSVLSCVLAYEAGDWPRVEHLSVAPDVLRAAYLDAIAWADAAAGGLRPMP